MTNEQIASLAIKGGILVILLIGIWYFVIEPIVHYHSLSVVCAAGHNSQISACKELQGY